MAIGGDGLEGLHEVLANLDKAEKQIFDLLRKWKLRTAVKVKGDAVKNTPREHGNLAASAYIDAKVRAQSGEENTKETDNISAIDGDTDVFVGFTASYAIFVHENMEERMRGEPRPSGLGVYWNPGHSKFLTMALYRNERESVQDLKNLLERTPLKK